MLDIDGDDVIDTTDPIALLKWLFLDGPSPAAPYLGCGALVEEAGLGCEDSNCPR